MAASDIRIIETDESHVERIAPLFDQYRVFYEQPSDLELAGRFIQERLSGGDSVIYLAVDGADADVGFVQLYPTFSSVAARSTWILNDLFVLPGLRGKGIGRLLLERARELAINSGARGLALSTARDNVRAQGLYESFGFERDTRFYHYFFSV